MDRIRQAVTRARKGQPTTTTTSHANSGNTPLRIKPNNKPFDPASLDERIMPVSCDFDQFSANRIISNEQDPVLNAYRLLRTRITQKMDVNGWKTLAVVSPNEKVGKTVTAINLAIALGAKPDIRPVLVDFDFHNPCIADYLGIKNYPSVLDYLEGIADLESVTVKPDLKDVLLMPNQRTSSKGAEYLTSQHINHLINTATTDFGSSIVIFDMSPMLGYEDTISFLPKVDCALLVVSSGQTRTSELKEAKRLLAKTNVIGTVLNKAPQMFMPNKLY